MSKEAMKLALEALEYIANETYDPWTNGAEAGRIAQTTLSKIKNKCRAIQTSDQMTCECGNVWDMNDPYPPKCTALREALAEQPAQQALDKMAENARELGLDYEPAQQEPMFTYDQVKAHIQAAMMSSAQRNRTWTQDHWTEYERSIAAEEREACAMWAWSAVLSMTDSDTADKVLAAIRARGNT